MKEKSVLSTRSLRSLGSWSGGGTPSKSNVAYWTDGTIPWVSPKDMKVSRIRDAEDRITPEAIAGSATNLVKAGAVVLVVRSGILKHSLPVAVTDVDVALNQDMKALQPAEGVDAAYVAWALRANAQKILHSCTKAGTTVQSIEMPAFLDFEIPLPHPDAQRQVVAEAEARLSLLDASVTGLHRVQANLKRYRASVLKSACEGRLVPTESKLARQEDRGTKVEGLPLPELPSSWTWKRFGELIQDGPQNGLYVPKTSYGSGVPIIRISDYQNGWSRPFSELQRVSIDPETAEAYRLSGHDILINRVNSLTHLGKILLVRADREMPVFESNMMRMRLAPAVVPEYAELYLQSSEGRARLIKGAKWAVNQASINQRDVRDCPFPVPPLAEQHRIVAEADRRLSLIRTAEAQVVANLARAQRLRQSILQAAFSA